ncbi:MAG: site-2 protease family protein [Bacillota bacterium]|nr:site-2 protease family protein [Bacillota bacterium]
MLFGEDPINIILAIPAILLAFTFHEFAHAIVADRLGDRTPRFQGRITLNPVAHIDPLGFILFVIARFGWAKPVQVNRTAFKNYYKDDIKVSVAGPVANLIIAVVFVPIALLYVKYFYYRIEPNNLYDIIERIIAFVPEYNVLLFFLNLMPIPGFDGYHILSDLFPSTFNKLNYKIGNYQMIIMILFIATPIAGYLIYGPADWTLNNLYSVFINIIKPI